MSPRFRGGRRVHAAPPPPSVPAPELHRALDRGSTRASKYEAPYRAAVEAVFDAEAKRVARRFTQMATGHALTAAAPEPASAMVAVYPTPEQAQALAQANGEPAAIIHCTLAFLGEIEVDQAEAVVAVLAKLAPTLEPLEGTVGGIASFDAAPPEDGQEPLYPSICLPDVPGLAELRQAVVEALEEAGIEYAQNHGWTPHLTLDYVAGAPGPPPAGVLGLPLSFDRVYMTRGDIPRGLPLGEQALAAAGEPPPWTPPHPDEVFDPQKFMDGLRTKTDPVRLAAIEAAVKDGLDLAGLSFDVANPLIGDALSKVGANVTYIADTTRVNVMRTIGTAYDEGLSIPDTAKLLSEGMAAAGPARAELIARTEMAGLVNGGQVAATQIVQDATGQQYFKRWLTADGAKDPRHEDYDGLDGQTVALDEAFDVGGAELQFPGDPEGPVEEVANCRCSLAMVESPDAEVDGGSVDDPSAEGDAPAQDDLSTDEPQGDPIEVLTDVGVAAKVFIDGLRITEARAGKDVVEAEMAKAEKNWRSHIKQSIDTDVPVGRIEQADAYNRTSPLHVAAVKAYGPENVLVLREGKIANLLNPGREEAAAMRLTGNRVTVVRKQALDEAKIEPRSGEEGIAPGAISSLEKGGFEAVLRHEYAHQLWEEMTLEQREAFRTLAPSTDRVAKELTRYASGQDMETFTELYAVVSDPAFNPSLWEPWVLQGRTQIERLLGLGPKAPLVDAPVLPKPPSPKVEHLSASRLATASTDDLWKALADNGKIDNLARADVSTVESQRIEAELWKRGEDDLPAGTLRFDHLQGESHLHTTASDGHNSVEEMARAAIGRGEKQMVVSDHAHLVTAEELRAQHVEIDRLNREFKGHFRILKGIEANILKDGSLDVPDAILKTFDRVNAGLHISPDVNPTGRLIRAAQNPYVTALAHPHAIPDVNYGKLAKVAAKENVALEINGRDMLRNDTQAAAVRMIRAAKKEGATIQIGADAHRAGNLVDSKYAARVAAQNGVTRADVVVGQVRPVAPAATLAEPAPLRAISGTTPAELARSVVARAQATEAGVTTALEGLVTSRGGGFEGLAFRLKSEESTARKIQLTANEMQIPVSEAAEQIRDSLRFTARYEEATYTADVEATLDGLKAQGFQVEKVKNYFVTEGYGYAGVNVVVRASNGFRFEVQFHTAESFAVKQETNHGFYEKWRASTNSAERQALLEQMEENALGVTRPPNVERIGDGLVAAAPRRLGLRV